MDYGCVSEERMEDVCWRVGLRRNRRRGALGGASSSKHSLSLEGVWARATMEGLRPNARHSRQVTSLIRRGDARRGLGSSTELSGR